MDVDILYYPSYKPAQQRLNTSILQIEVGSAVANKGSNIPDSPRVLWIGQFQPHPVARQSKVITDNPLAYFAVVISDLPSPQCLRSRLISSFLQEPLLPADSSADPSIQPILEKLVDQIADPCFQCDPLIMASFPCHTDARKDIFIFQLISELLQCF
ncbi:hypothetical protein AYI69_g1368 [Smittium culicis]|uniref:Uncharacterized protein n=1 Tax=Smittium culicis TaxID=133412 RepID=A0A1R1YQH4_9FUNG|nr:hypothetical protein AYI69_g1368 [Smittium culicis]